MTRISVTLRVTITDYVVAVPDAKVGHVSVRCDVVFVKIPLVCAVDASVGAGPGVLVHLEVDVVLELGGSAECLGRAERPVGANVDASFVVIGENPRAEVTALKVPVFDGVDVGVAYLFQLGLARLSNAGANRLRGGLRSLNAY